MTCLKAYLPICLLNCNVGFIFYYCCASGIPKTVRDRSEQVHAFLFLIPFLFLYSYNLYMVEWENRIYVVGFNLVSRSL